MVFFDFPPIYIDFKKTAKNLISAKFFNLKKTSKNAKKAEIQAYR